MRTWVSFETQERWGSDCQHDRKIEIAVLRYDDDLINFCHIDLESGRIKSEDVYKLPLYTFLGAYEPMQESFKFICHQIGNPRYINYTEEEKVNILLNLKNARVLG